MYIYIYTYACILGPHRSLRTYRMACSISGALSSSKFTFDPVLSMGFPAVSDPVSQGESKSRHEFGPEHWGLQPQKMGMR